jgi:hypothetical protein
LGGGAGGASLRLDSQSVFEPSSANWKTGSSAQPESCKNNVVPEQQGCRQSVSPQ